MASVNSVTLLGRVGQDPETRYLADDNCVANFNLATSKKFKDRNGQTQEKTEWHRLVFWGKVAKIASEYVRKGSLIYVEGEIQYEQWEKDGVKQYATKINCFKLQLLGEKNENQSQSRNQGQTNYNQGQTNNQSSNRNQNQGSQQNTSGQNFEKAPAQNFDDFDDDIPF